MGKVVRFHDKCKAENLEAYLDQVSTLSDVDEYERMVKRLTDRGKLTTDEDKRLTLILKRRRAILKQ